MQALARLSVNRPVVATVLVLVFVVVGVFSATHIGVDRFPDIDFPIVTIVTVLPGATPDEMDTQVTEEIEKQVNTVSGIDTLASTSSEGMSLVMVRFVLERNVDEAAQDVRSKVDLALPNLPDGVEKPVVQKMDAAATPILTIALSAKDAPIREVTEYADKGLRPQIESISGVGDVEIIGGQARQINVLLDPYRLRAFGLTPMDVSQALQAQNLQVPGGAFDLRAHRISVRTQGRVTDMRAMEDLVVTRKLGQPIRIRDVARVEDAEEEVTSVANVNDERAVLLDVRKQSGGNTVAVVNAIKARLEKVRPSLPPGYECRVVADQSTFIEAALRAVEEHLVMGAILAALVVLVFLWNWRSAIIASIAIPASLISAFALMATMGFTMNVVTMLALTLAVGIVIDDAVIVLENIYRFLEQRATTPRQAAIEATQEIGLAVLATTLSLLAVFVPIAFMTGIVGRVFRSFGLTMAFAILMSLLIAFTLAPMLSARWLRRPRGTHHGPSADGEHGGHDAADAAHHGVEHPHAAHGGGGLLRRVEDVYEGALAWALRHRWAVVLGCAAVFMTVGPLGKAAKVNFIPDDDESRFTVSVRAPEDTSASATERLLSQIGADIRTLPEVSYTVVSVASDRQRTPNAGTVDVHMNEVEERKTSTTQTDVMVAARKMVRERYPRELRISVTPPSAIGGAAQAQIQYVVTGPDLDVTTKACNRIVAELGDSGLVTDTDTSAIIGKPETEVTVDRNRAAELGISVAQIATTLRTLVAGDDVSSFAEGGYLYDINVRAEDKYRGLDEDLSLFLVSSSEPQVGRVPLRQVVSYKKGLGPSVITRSSRARGVTISANPVPGGSEQQVQAKVRQVFSEQNLGPQYQGQFSGRARELGSTMVSFVMALVLAVIFMFLILAAQFESWVTPLVILTVLPLTLPFALFSLWFLNGSLNIFSMLGMLVLFGVVMKNAILQVDHANGLRAEGMDRTHAILLACRDRFRPIMMTTIAFVASMIPLALSSGTGAGTNRAMSHVIIGGQTLSLLLTLIATPVFYALADSAVLFLQRVRARVVRSPHGAE